MFYYLLVYLAGGIHPSLPAGKFSHGKGIRKSWRTCHLVGDLVLLREANLVHNQWSHTHITRILPHSDGKVRCVELKKPGGSLWIRDIRNLCKLECQIY